MGRRATVTLAGSPEEGLRLEAFIDSLGLPQDQRSRLLIVATELFENVCRHSGLIGDRVTVSVRRGGAMTLLILFKSSGFAEYVRSGGGIEPRYSRAEKRYRGLGTRMVKNLSQSVHLHPGTDTDGYLVTF